MTQGYEIDKPNVLWIFCDQMRGSAMDCAGDPNFKGKTPNLDRLASEGTRFTHAYSQTPVCTPFRGGVYTGQYGHINGVRRHGDLLAPDKRTIAHAFQDAGYRTSLAGKWHLASTLAASDKPHEARDYWVHPQLRGGFEDWYGSEGSSNFYLMRYSHGETIDPPHELRGYQTNALTDLSIDYLGTTGLELNQKGQPWFHVLSLEAPHPGCDENGNRGYPAPQEYMDRFDPNTLQLHPAVPEELREKALKDLHCYCAMIACIDDNIGRLLDWLDDQGLADDTLIMFFSDHGEMGGAHGKFQKEWPHEGSIHIPMLARCPSKVAKNNVIDSLVSGIDIYPTTAELVGVPIEPQVQGVSHAGKAQGVMDTTDSRDGVLLQWLDPPRYPFFGQFEYRGIRTNQYTYCVCTDPSLCVLFDNDADPYQINNLYEKFEGRSIRSTLHDRLASLILQSGEVIPEFVDQAKPPMEPAND